MSLLWQLTGSSRMKTVVKRKNRSLVMFFALRLVFAAGMIGVLKVELHLTGPLRGVHLYGLLELKWCEFGRGVA